MFTQAPTSNKEEVLIYPGGWTPPVSFKRRKMALSFLLLSVIRSIVAAAIVFVLLRCFKTVEGEGGSNRFLSDNEHKELVGACGGAHEEGPDLAPRAGTENNLSPLLSDRVRSVLKSAENLINIFRKTLPMWPPGERMKMVLNLQVLICVELGALSIFLDPLLEEEKKAVLQNVTTVAIDALRATRRSSCNTRFYCYIKKGICLLRTMMENTAEPVELLLPAERDAKLSNLLELQDGLSIKTAEEHFKIIELLREQGVKFDEPEMKLNILKVKIICHFRKKQVINDPLFFKTLQKFEHIAGSSILNLNYILTKHGKLGPPLSPAEQIHELQAALSDPKEIPPTRSGPAKGSVVQAQPASPPSPQPHASSSSPIPPQPAEKASPLHLPPKDVAVPLHIPASLFLGTPFVTPTPYSYGAQPESFLSASVLHPYRPDDYIPPFQHQNLYHVSPLPQPLSAQSAAVGAHRQSQPFYGHQEGMPAWPDCVQHEALAGEAQHLLSSLGLFINSELPSAPLPHSSTLPPGTEYAGTSNEVAPGIPRSPDSED